MKVKMKICMAVLGTAFCMVSQTSMAQENTNNENSEKVVRTVTIDRDQAIHVADVLTEAIEDALDDQTYRDPETDLDVIDIHIDE